MILGLAWALACWPDYPDDWDGDPLDASIHPGAEEVWYDDIDQACDGGSDHDADGDGHDADEDCDDQDPAVHPEAEEVCGDGVDNDCVGAAPECRLSGELSVDTAAFRVLGEADSALGHDLETADVDGDGVTDLVVGAPDWSEEGSGAAYLVRGPLVGDLDLGRLAWDGDEGDLVAWRGWGTGTALGGTNLLADVTGDGLLELVLGVPRAPGTLTGGAIFITPTDVTGEVRLETASDVVQITAVPEDLDFGRGLSEDGRGGLWVGAPGPPSAWYSSPDFSNYDTRVYHLPELPGADANVARLDDTSMWRSVDDEEGDGAGFVISAIGDLTGDGVPEAAVAAPDGSDQRGWYAYGRVYILDGSLGGGQSYMIHQDSLGLLIGISKFSQTGYAMANTGDVDGDGTDDLLIGAPAERSPSDQGTETGRAYLVLGGDPRSWPDPRGIETAEASFESLGADTAVGRTVAGAGDFDDEGHADLLISARDPDQEVTVVHLVYGPVSGTHTLADSVSVPVEQGALLRGVAVDGAEDLTGLGLAGAHDLTGDGVPDLVLSDPLEASSGVIYGVAGPGL